MPLDSNETPALDLALHAARYYAALTQAVGPNADAALGGKLLYAGELDAEARALIVAANIAGAASLAATASQAAQKQAIKDGVADFLVTSLDEALRILKNEIRKRETVAICVAAAPEAIEQEMLERGVLSDLLRSSASAGSVSAIFLSQRALEIQLPALDANQTLLAWSVASAPLHWLPKLDTIALDCLNENKGAPGLDSETWDSARRWLRLSPRYLGRMAQSVRVLNCAPNIAKEFVERVQGAVKRGEIGVEVRIKMNGSEKALNAD